jgi:hypothetical protein
MTFLLYFVFGCAYLLTLAFLLDGLLDIALERKGLGSPSGWCSSDCELCAAYFETLARAPRRPRGW